MASHFTQIRGEAMAVDVETTHNTAPVAGQMEFDSSTGKLYIYDATQGWMYSQGTTTSTSTSSTSSSSTSTSSTSSSSSSTSTSSTSSSSSSSSTSTTLL